MTRLVLTAVRPRRLSAVLAAVALGACAPGPALGAAPPADGGCASVSGLGALHELGALRRLPPGAAGAERLVLGDVHGFIHVYERRGDAYEETWLSAYLEGAIGGIVIADINRDGLDEIVAYTRSGRIFHLDSRDYSILWSNPPSEYQSITALIVHNVDDDGQDEMILCADGRLVIYDGRNHFEEWRSEQSGVRASDLVVADVDGDGAEEIVLNDGLVFDARFHDLEWQSPEAFGERLGAVDIDGDGICEIIGEYDGRYLRIFDIDLRRMKPARQ